MKLRGQNMGLLRTIFGPSKNEVWRQFSEQVGGDFIKSGFFSNSVVRARHKQWTITLDTYSQGDAETSTDYTRIRAPYVTKDGFWFTIYRKGFFTGVGKLLGMQDVEIGDPAFDEAFVIKGGDEQLLRKLFADPAIRQLIERQPKFHLTVKDNEGWLKKRLPDGVDELLFEVEGVITDLDLLRSLYDLFVELLNRLCEIGSAYEHDPGVVL